MIRLRGNAAGAEDFLAMVDVVEEGVQRLHALLDALRAGAAIQLPEMMRGTMSNGISRSDASCSP